MGEKTGSGDLYALPKDASVFAYAYNKDIFDEAGIPYPDPENPYTYEEFVQMYARNLQKIQTEMGKSTSGAVVWPMPLCFNSMYGQTELPIYPTIIKQ